jgi:hypothetical protein
MSEAGERFLNRLLTTNFSSQTQKILAGKMLERLPDRRN